MLRPFLFLALLGPSIVVTPTLAAPLDPSIGVCEDPCDASNGGDPEIDRSPIWAMHFGRYLYLLGREMFWPELDQREKFSIGVVGWDDLAEDLGSRLDGRSIAGLPVEIKSLDAKTLREHKGDFTVLFLSGTDGPTPDSSIEEALIRWSRKKDKQALIITDGGEISASDLSFRRSGEGANIGLCIVQQEQNLQDKGMALPVPFLQRICP